MFANFLWAVEVPLREFAIPLAAGLVGGGLSLLAARIIYRQKQIPARPQATMIDETRRESGSLIPNHDPYDLGSSTEKRLAARRKGNRVEVFIEPLEPPKTPFTGWVTNRSVSGLGIEIDMPIPNGTRFNVIPVNAPSVTPWVTVEVKNCRETKNGWEIGCHFPKQPPWAILLQFG